MEKQSNDIYQKATHLEETDVTLDFTTKDSGEREHWDSGAARHRGRQRMLPPVAAYVHQACSRIVPAGSREV